MRNGPRQLCRNLLRRFRARFRPTDLCAVVAIFLSGATLTCLGVLETRRPAEQSALQGAEAQQHETVAQSRKTLLQEGSVPKPTPTGPGDGMHWILLGAGLLISGIAALYVRGLDRSWRKAAQQAAEMATQFERRTTDLETVNHELTFQKSALDHAAIVSETDANGSITYVNDQFCALSGYTREELLGRNHRLINSGEHPRAFWKQAFEALARDGVWHGVACNRTKGGTLYWVQNTIVAFRNQQGLVTRYIAIGTNVSDRVRGEKQILESERLARGTIESLNAHVVILDERGYILAVNRAWREFYTRNGGRTGGELVGTNYLNGCRGSEDQACDLGRRAYEGTWDVLRGLIPEFSMIYDCHAPDTKRWFMLRVTRFEGSGSARAVVTHTDITDSQIAAERLREQADELKNAKLSADAANRAKGEFLATMSHEIRTPLNGVIGMLDLVAGTALNETQRRYLELAKSSATSLMTVINDILDFSRVEAGKLELCHEDFELDTVVEDVVTMLAPRAQQKSLELTCCIEPGMTRHVRGDPSRLRQILLNLVGNAIKFTDHGSITVRAVLEERSERGQLVRFTITDTGIGIRPEKLDRLFKSFSQADASTTRRHGGSGLGLAISKHLAELMGGSIGVVSEVDHGSTFWFTAQLEEAPHQKESANRGLSHLRILVACDSSIQRTFLCEQLASWGAEILQAEILEQALVMLRDAGVHRAPISLVIVDSELTGGNPAAVAADIGKAADDTPILLLQPLVSSTDADALQMVGFAGIIAKPIRESQLLDTVVKAVGRSQSRPGLQAEPSHAAASPSREALYRGRVLVAEDNEINQIVIQEILANVGLECHIVSDGRQAVEAISAGDSNYLLVIMDCQMPLMDGFEATRKIREREQIARGGEGPGLRMPIIALTANAMKGDREACLDAGMDAYVSKPIAPLELLRTIDECVRRPQQKQNAA